MKHRDNSNDIDEFWYELSLRNVAGYDDRTAAAYAPMSAAVVKVGVGGSMQEASWRADNIPAPVGRHLNRTGR